MELFESTPPASEELLAQQQRAARAEKKARAAEKRAGRFLATMLDDLRIYFRTRRERTVLRREEQQLRIKNKWARIVWRDPMY